MQIKVNAHQDGDAGKIEFWGSEQEFVKRAGGTG